MSYIKENYLGKVEPQFLIPYLAQRSDWSMYEKNFEHWVTGEPIGLDGRNFKDRLGINRLSIMMKDLEVMKFGDGLDTGGALSKAFGGSISRLST